MLQYIEIGLSAVLAEADADLPPFLGTTLRGAFGLLFKRTVCQARHGRCVQCGVRTVCPYPAVFEGLAPEGRQIMRRYDTIPQPFVLLVPSPGQRWGRPGELVWGFRLFGAACRFWPYVVHTFDAAGKAGIGRGRWKYTIQCVTDGIGGNTLWTPGCSDWAEPAQRHIDHCASTVPPHCTLRWRFETPLRLRSSGMVRDEQISPMDLLLNGRRRFSIMRHFYDADGSELPPDERLDAGRFRIISEQVFPWAHRRYSLRQKRRMVLGGLLGEMVIEGPWGLSGPWLNAVPILHLGKATTFGFGNVKWEML